MEALNETMGKNKEKKRMYFRNYVVRYSLKEVFIIRPEKEKKKRERSLATCCFRHASLSDILPTWRVTALAARLLPVLITPLPVGVGLKVRFLHL